jgi:hypothetical protein
MAEKTIAKEVKQMSGFDDVENLREAMPKDIDGGDAKGPLGYAAPKKRRAKSTSTPTAPKPGPNLMDDKRYAEACAEMSAFGGKGVIIRGFDAGAVALDDPSFRLKPPEERQWDNFFYVLSKKPLFDVGRPWFLAAFFIITLLSQLGWRVFERSEIPILQELFPNQEKKAEREQEKAQSAGV